MSVARPQLRGTEERIRWHLAGGSHASAVWLYLIWVYGRDWRRWREPETLRERMAASAREFCEGNGVDLYWARQDCKTVRRAYRYVEEMILHQAHVKLGCPYGWRKRGDRRKLTMAEAQQALDEKSRKLAEYSEVARENTNLRHQQLAQWNKLEAKRLRDRGAGTPEIARILRVDERTVRRYLEG